MNHPILLENVLRGDLFLALQDDLRYWENSNYSYEDNSPTFLGRINPDELVFKQAQTVIKYKIQKHFDYHLVSERVHLNAAFPNQRGSVFHIDNDTEDHITFVLYTNTTWNTQWGGETVVCSRLDGKYHYSPYLPNHGCFFPSHWEHYGASPNAHTDMMRTSVAFIYKVCYNCPIKPNKL